MPLPRKMWPLALDLREVRCLQRGTQGSYHSASIANGVLVVRVSADEPRPIEGCGALLQLTTASGAELTLPSVGARRVWRAAGGSETWHFPLDVEPEALAALVPSRAARAPGSRARAPKPRVPVTAEVEPASPWWSGFATVAGGWLSPA